MQSLRTSKEYRHAFVDEAIRTRITAQTKAIREHRKWDYKQFAEAIGKKLSWAYRLEDPNEAPPTIPTLLQIAEAFDIGLDVRFCSFSELLADVTTLTPESFEVQSFEEELAGATPASKARHGRKARRRANTRRCYRRKSKAGPGNQIPRRPPDQERQSYIGKVPGGSNYAAASQAVAKVGNGSTLPALEALNG